MVFVNAESQRSGQVAPGFLELQRTVDARVTFVTDTPRDREQPYNVGECEVAVFPERRGYRDDGLSTWR